MTLFQPLTEDDKHLMETWLSGHAWRIGDTLFLAHPLLFHWALLVNPTEHGYEERYCFASLPLLARAVRELPTTGKLRYFQKDHTRNLSIVDGYVYPPGVRHIPDNAIDTVDW